MGNIILDSGTQIVTKDSTGSKGVPLDARGMVNYYEDIKDLPMPYIPMKVIVNNDSLNGEHQKGEYVVTKLTDLGDVDETGIIPIKDYIPETDPTVPAHVKAITQQNITDWNNSVPNTRTVNGKALSSNVQLTASDIGAQPPIDNSHKLSADNIEDGSTNKVVTQTEKNTWNGKQNALDNTQLANIDKGGTALQPSSTSGLLKNDGTIDTETQGKAANAIQMPSGASSDKVLGYENGAVSWVDKPQDGEKGPKGNDGADAVNPFKGYYPSGVNKPDTGAIGDYLYAPPSDSQSTATATIWHYDSTQTPPWTDTGIDVSDVVAVEFGSGQSVPGTKIKNESGDDVSGSADVLSAEAGMELNLGLNGGYRVTSREDINPQTDLTDAVVGFLRIVNSGSSTAWSWLAENGNGSTAFLTLSNLDISPTHIVVKASTVESRVAFLKQKLPSGTDVNQATLKSTYIADDGEIVGGVSYPYHVVPATETRILEIPTGTNFISIKLSTGSYSHTPAAISFFNGTYVEGLTTQVNGLSEKVGDTAQLETTDKTSVVNAINELKENIGDGNNLKFVVGTKVTISEGFDNLSTRIATGLSGKAGYKYRVTCDNTLGGSKATWKLFTDTTSSYILYEGTNAGNIWTRIVELNSDIKEFYVSCNVSAATITIEVLGTNEDMFPLDLKAVGLEQGNIRPNNAGDTPEKLSSNGAVRLVSKIPAIKRDWNGLRVWFAELPPNIVRDGQEVSGSWYYRCYFLDASGKNITAAGTWKLATTSFNGANNNNGNFETNANNRQAAYIWMSFIYSADGSTGMEITPNDIPFGSLRMVMGRDYSSVVESMNLRETKVTTINSSSTNEQIPTAKAVYDLASGSEGAVSYLSKQALTKVQRNNALYNIGLGIGGEIEITKDSRAHPSTSDVIKVNIPKGMEISAGLFFNHVAPNLSTEIRLFDYDPTITGSSGKSVTLGGVYNVYFTVIAPFNVVAVGVRMNSDTTPGTYTLRVKGGILNELEHTVVNDNRDAIDRITTARMQPTYSAGLKYNKYSVFVQATDTHITGVDTEGDIIPYSVCLNRIMEFADNIGGVSAVFHTGDIIDSADVNPTSYWDSLMEEYKTPMLAIVGNHEFSVANYSDEDIYNWLYKSELQQRNGETHGTVDNTPKNWFYKDIKSSQLEGDTTTRQYIRVIGMYCFEKPVESPNKAYQWFSQDQIDWLLDTLDGTLTDRVEDGVTWKCSGVIVLSHHRLSNIVCIDSPWNVSNRIGDTIPVDIMTNVGVEGTYENVSYSANRIFFGQLFKAFVDGGTINTSILEKSTHQGVVDAQSVISVNHTFSSQGKFIANICGHVHNGGVGHMIVGYDAQNNPIVDENLRVVASPCSTELESYQRCWWGRTQTGAAIEASRASKMVDLFNVFVWDSVKNTLKVIRVGSTINANLEECKAICLKAPQSNT